MRELEPRDEHSTAAGRTSRRSRDRPTAARCVYSVE
jgi:hypothetical protein